MMEPGGFGQGRYASSPDNAYHHHPGASPGYRTRKLPRPPKCPFFHASRDASLNLRSVKTPIFYGKKMIGLPREPLRNGRPLQCRRPAGGSSAVVGNPAVFQHQRYYAANAPQLPRTAVLGIGCRGISQFCVPSWRQNGPFRVQIALVAIHTRDRRGGALGKLTLNVGKCNVRFRPESGRAIDLASR